MAGRLCPLSLAPGLFFWESSVGSRSLHPGSDAGSIGTKVLANRRGYTNLCAGLAEKFCFGIQAEPLRELRSGPVRTRTNAPAFGSIPLELSGSPGSR